MIEILIIIKIIKMILTTIVIVIITTIIIIIIIKCIGRYRTPTTINNGTPCEIAEWSKAFRQDQKELPLDALRSLYTTLKRLIHHLTWWIGVDYTVWIPCLELSLTWFLKNNWNNTNYNNNNNDRIDINDHSSNIIIRLK